MTSYLRTIADDDALTASDHYPHANTDYGPTRSRLYEQQRDGHIGGWGANVPSTTDKYLQVHAHETQLWYKTVLSHLIPSCKRPKMLLSIFVYFVSGFWLDRRLLESTYCKAKPISPHVIIYTTY